MIEALRRFEAGEPLIGHDAATPFERLRGDQSVIPIDEPWQSVGSYDRLVVRACRRTRRRGFGAPSTAQMPKLRLSLACWDYDRTRALTDGRVHADGIDLVYQALPVEETFFRMMRHREFDVAEMSLSSYLVSTFRDDPFVAIPVFPSRSFRHSCIFVNERSGIREPHDLIGKRVGVPEYQLTANVWIRGILADEYGVRSTA